MASDRSSRRRFLTAGGVLSTGCLAGCLREVTSFGDDDDRDPDGDSEDPPSELRINDRALSSAYPLELVDPDAEDVDRHVTGEDLVAHVHFHEDGNTHWHFAPLELRRGESRHLRARFVDDDHETVPIGDDEPYRLEVVPTGEDSEDLLTVDVDEHLVSFVGNEPGTGELVFELWNARQNEVVWASPPLEVAVTGADGERIDLRPTV